MNTEARQRIHQIEEYLKTVPDLIKDGELDADVADLSSTALLLEAVGLMGYGEIAASYARIRAAV